MKRKDFLGIGSVLIKLAMEFSFKVKISLKNALTHSMRHIFYAFGRNINRCGSVGRK
jgi:hypothetical protein